MSKTARVLPRLFNRASNSAPSTSSVPLSSSRGAPESSGSSRLLNLRNRKRRRGRKLSDFTSIVEWERVYFQRKKTLLMKAMELEEATGAIVRRISEDFNISCL
ncbi:unnamed protein product [Clavelina lepadiformis]|uniref:Uncharacterized protein n=1 Tax=Clavelina lepadiformis TaxID=159417 RepID=A0ABP0G8C1_CLALP